MTDLEYHGCPHVFCSQDSLPLVTTVARWRPERKEIYLADLWVKPEDLLYITPKVFNPNCIDMHNNRNWALACSSRHDRTSIYTNTTLDPDVMPSYHSENHATVHGVPA
jgi:hypothetical protein